MHIDNPTSLANIIINDIYEVGLPTGPNAFFDDNMSCSTHKSAKSASGRRSHMSQKDIVRQHTFESQDIVKEGLRDLKAALNDSPDNSIRDSS